MKKLFFLLTFAYAFAACKSSSGPGFDESAIMPKAGSVFTYQVVAPQGQLQEQTTITNVSNNSFTALRRSDTVSNFSTSDSENYSLLPSGDLWPIMTACCCDSEPLPIASHKSFDSPNNQAATPTKLNGFVDNNSSVTWHSQYEGEVTIFAAGTNFDCSQVSKSVTVIAVSPTATANGESDTVVVKYRYWYSSAIGFFVKDEEIEQTGGVTKTDYSRTLVSYK